MANNEPATVEALVLKDDSGNWYVIPRETLEQHKLNDDQRQQIESTLSEDDVSGFSLLATPPAATFGQREEGHVGDERNPAMAHARVANAGSLLLGHIRLVDSHLLSAGPTRTMMSTPRFE